MYNLDPIIVQKKNTMNSDVEKQTNNVKRKKLINDNNQYTHIL